MKRTIRELLVKLGVVSGTKEVEQFDAALERAKSTARAAAAGVAVLSGALAGVIFTTARAGDDVAKTAEQLALSTDEYQELAKAADRAKVSQEEFAVGMRQFARNAALAAQGQGEAKDALAAWQIDLTDASGELRPMSELLNQVADAAKEEGNELRRSALASRIFGESGSKLIPLLTEGSAGIAALRQEARDLGLVMSEEATKSSEEFMDRLGDARDILIGLKRQIGLAFIPALNRMLTAFRDWFIVNKEVIQQRLDRAVTFIREQMEGFLALLRHADRFVRERVGGWENLFRQIGKVLLVGGIVQGFRTVLTLASAVKAAAVAALTAISIAGAPVTLTIGAIALALGAILLVGEDLMVFMRGGKSVIGDFLDAFGQADEVHHQLALIRSEARNLWIALQPVIVAIARGFGRALVALTHHLPAAIAIGTAAIGGLRALLDKVRRDLAALRVWVTAPFEAMRIVITDATNWLEVLLTKVQGFMEQLGQVRRMLPVGALGQITGAVTEGLFDAQADRARGAIRGGRELARRFGARQQGGSSETTVVQNNTMQISGLGLGESEVDVFFERSAKTLARGAAAASVGGGR